MLTEGKEKRPVVVVGAGAWGTALSIALARAGNEVLLLPRFAAEVESLKDLRENVHWLPGIPLPREISVGSSFEELCTEELPSASAIFWVVPVQFSVESAQILAPVLPKECPILLCSKGFLCGASTPQDLFLSEALKDLFPHRTIGVLSGPNFAREVAEGKPAMAAMALPKQHFCEVAHLLQTPKFRLFETEDTVSLQIAGALKNVLAVACGLATGLGWGQNARAALLTLGFRELVSLGCALGSCLETLIGVGGLGDVQLTCLSDQSRNTRLGIRLGQGERLADILKENSGVAEGVSTAKPAYVMARSLKVSTPLFDALYRVLYEGESPQVALERAWCNAT